MLSFSSIFSTLTFIITCFFLSNFIVKAYDEAQWLYSNKREIFLLKHCTSHTVTRLNFEDAYLYLRKILPEVFLISLLSAKDNFIDLLKPYEACPKFLFSDLKILPHKEKNRNFSNSLPNWVIRYK